ncbi:hypothetical protein BGZ70_002354, partial [Mortierella alpina]
MGRRNVDNEKLMVGTDTRDRRQRQRRYLTSALLFVLFVAVLALSHHHHYFGHPHRPHPPPHHPPHPPPHRHRVPWDGPRKIVIQERKALIMLGWGKADLVSHAILELAPVQHITLHILHAEVSSSRRRPQPKQSHPSSDRPKEPVLQFKVATIVDSTLVTFYIPEDDPEDSGRLTVKIQVPYGFDGSLSLDGSFLDIRGLAEQQQWWQWQRQRLSLTTDEGNIDLRGWNTRAAVFKAVVKRRGDVFTGTLEEAVLGGGLEAVVKSAVGLVSLDVSMTPSLEPLEWTGGYHIQTVVGQGRLQLNVQESQASEVEGGVDGVVAVGVRPRVLRIAAETKAADMDARIELMEGQELHLEAKSTGEANINL